MHACMQVSAAHKGLSPSAGLVPDNAHGEALLVHRMKPAELHAHVMEEHLFITITVGDVDTVHCVWAKMQRLCRHAP